VVPGGSLQKGGSSFCDPDALLVSECGRIH
jgi:hypothetical protein